ncbi:hypothetical protein O9G_005746, partial [Rozella allomycis CSF55]
MKIEGSGEVSLRVQTNDGKIKEVRLYNVLYVPSMNTNLLSIPKLLRNAEITVVMEGETCSIRKNETEIMRGKLEKQLFTIKTMRRQPKALNTKETKNEMDVWHRRLGHACEPYLRQMSEKGSVTGMPKFKRDAKLSFCHTCAKHKATRASFKGKMPRENKVGGKLHTDLMGPMEKQTMAGKRYILTIIDDHSRKCFIHLLSHKCLLEDGNLPKDFWGEIAHTACYIQNRTPTKILGGKTPEEVYSGKKPDIRHMREIGAPCYVHIGKSKRLKLDGKAELHYLIGYEHGSRMYRLRVGNTNKVRVSAHVKFHEDMEQEDEEDDDEYYTRIKEIVDQDENENKLEVLEDLLTTTIKDDARAKLEALQARLAKLKLEREKLKDDKQISKEQVKTIVAQVQEPRKTIKKAITELTPMTESSMNQVISPQATLKPHDGSKTDEPRIEKPSNTRPRGSIIEEIKNEIIAKEGSIKAALEKSKAKTKKKGVEIFKARQTNNDANKVVKGTMRSRSNGGLRDIKRPNYEEPREVAFMALKNFPRNFIEAMSADDAEKWFEAMKREISSHNEHKTWELVKRPEGVKVHSSRWVNTKKYDENGNLIKYKCRLVFRGHTQVKGRDYFETYAPVAKSSSIKAMIALSAKYGWILHQADVETAYLNGTVREVLYMEQPEGFAAKGAEDMVCKINKALYGLKQAGREWNRRIDRDLKRAGFKRCKADYCVYTKRVRDKIIIIALYVDDIIIAANCAELLKETKEYLAQQYKIKDLGKLNWCLGVHIEQDEKNKEIRMSQEAFIDETLRKFGFEDCAGIATPMEKGIYYSADQSPKNETEKARMASIPYREAIGNLQWLQAMTRPDISSAVSIASRFVENPGEEHWKLLKRIMRYLKATKKYCLTYKCDGGAVRKENERIEVEGFSDADWATDRDNRKSTTGYLIYLDGNLVSWKSRKQQTNALSTAEAEYMALADTAREGLWMMKLIKELRIPRRWKPRALKINEDNQSTIRIAQIYESNEKTKHIEQKYHFIRDKIEKGRIYLNYVNTKEMVADALTKGLAREPFEKHRESMGILERPAGLRGSVGVKISDKQADLT